MSYPAAHVPIDALALPLLLATLIGLVVYALHLRRLERDDARGGWILLAVIVLATAASAAALGILAGFVGFGLYFLLVLLPFSLRHRLHRAITAGDEARARRLAWILARMHPTRLVRDEVAALPTILALRAGDQVAPEDLDRIAHGLPHVRRAFDVILLHNQRDVDAVRAAFADPDERTNLLAQGLGGVYVQAVGCCDPDGDVLAEALARAQAGDPTLQHPDRAARLVLQAHALAGDVARTAALADGLGMYLSRGDREFLLALAHWCAGARDDARRILADALQRHRDHRVARAMLASFDAMIARRDPRPPTARTPALDRRLAALRRSAPSLRAVATFIGRHARKPILTRTWIAVLVLYYLAFALAGDPYDLRHAYNWGALFTWRVPLPPEALAEFPELVPFGVGQAFRLFTFTLVHHGVLHLGLNALMLWTFGGFVEALYGRRRLAAIYVLGGVLSGLAVVLLSDPDQPHFVMGASGAVMATGGAVIAALLRRRDLRNTRIGRTELTLLVVLFAVQFVFDSLTPEVSSTAHLAGLLAGLLLGALLLPRDDTGLSDMAQDPATPPAA